jgi:hypothetical protein
MLVYAHLFSTSVPLRTMHDGLHCLIMVRFLAKKGLIFLNGQMKGSSEFDLEHEIIYKTRVKETRRGINFSL